MVRRKHNEPGIQEKQGAEGSVTVDQRGKDSALVDNQDWGGRGGGGERRGGILRKRFLSKSVRRLPRRGEKSHTKHLGKKSRCPD